MASLSPRSIPVTGATSGIGRAGAAGRDTGAVTGQALAVAGGAL